MCNSNETSESLTCETPIEKIKSFTFSEVTSNSPCTPERTASILSTTHEKMNKKTIDNSDRVKLLYD